MKIFQKKINRLTAGEARTIMASSTFLDEVLAEIYTDICDAARKGNSSFCWCYLRYPKETSCSVKQRLEEDGYKIELDKSLWVWRISW